MSASYEARPPRSALAAGATAALDQGDIDAAEHLAVAALEQDAKTRRAGPRPADTGSSGALPRAT